MGLKSKQDSLEEVTGIGGRVRRQLRQRMARECEAMAQYALSTGRTVPVEVVERLDQALSALDALTAAAAPGRCGVDDSPRVDATVASVPSAEMSPLASLSVAHGALAQIIAPATPEAVTRPLLYSMGPLQIGRQMLGLAILSVILLLGIALSEEINPVNMGKTMLTLSGYALFVKEVFLVSAASLGSCFQNLQRINAVIADGTYDPKFQSTYWTRWAMGVISGIIISQLVYVFLIKAPPTIPGQPILALLGGYSIDLVHGILSGTIDTLASFFSRSRDEAIDNQTRARVTSPGAGKVGQGLRSVRPAARSYAQSRPGPRGRPEMVASARPRRPGRDGGDRG
jgi:hypothetical protein